MSATVVETPVELLVLGDDRLASRDAMPVLVTATSTAPIMDRLRAGPGSVNMEDEEDDELTQKIEEPSVHPPPSPRVETSRLESQNPLAVPPLCDHVPSVNQSPPTFNQSLPTVDCNVTVPETDAVVDEDNNPAETVSDKGVPASTQPEKKTEELSTPSVPAAAMGEVQAFLYHKIADNQCSSHAKEIHEYLANRLSDSQQIDLLPAVMNKLSQHFQHEAAGQEVSVDIQTSICVLEQMFMLVGRRSPLQDMYTAEEEELLEQLSHAGTSSKTLLAV